MEEKEIQDNNTGAIDLRRVSVTRYITPLREGGSLPALADADDGFKYVVKFRGAGHGTKALISEFIGGELARAAGSECLNSYCSTSTKISGAPKPMRKYKTCSREAPASTLDFITCREL